ncbi:nucleotidyltransferase domain-containing protein [Veronia nyctiphanis]|nr:nucleotidyltransferase domain-containing protein [Veronia nyctiphanis]
MTDRGLTEDGYIKNYVSLDNVQREFKPVLEATVNALKSEFQSYIHSVYLYGSVGRGNATPYQSDLDICIVTHEPLSESLSSELEEVAYELNNTFNIISKLEFDIGHYEEVMIKNDFEWQCWLKHFCTCIWGDDLTKVILPCKPKTAVFCEMNKDIQQRLDKAFQVNPIDADFKSLAKKILRTDYGLVAEEDNSYFTELEEIVGVLLNEDRDKDVIQQAHKIAAGKCCDAEMAKNILANYGKKVADSVYSYLSPKETS